MKLVIFPHRKETVNRWWHRLVEVVVLGTTVLSLLFAILITSGEENKSLVVLLPIFTYAICVGLYATLLYVVFGSNKHIVSREIEVEMDLDKLAITQKFTSWALVVMVITFFLAIPGYALQTVFGTLFGVALLCHLIIGLRLAWLVKMKHKWLLLLSLLFPIITLGFLHNANYKATKILRSAGRKVGFFGGIMS